jgi:hypothetical protein
MADEFEGYFSGLDSPASDALEVVPNDSADLATTARAIYVGGAGDVKIDTVRGSTVTFRGVLAGYEIPVRTRRVHSTGTTATNMIAMW